MIKLSQENRQARIDTPLGEDVLLLQQFSGTEALSKDYNYSMMVLSEDPAIDGNALVGKRISATYFDEDGRERHFNGFVSRFEYGQQVEEPVKATAYAIEMVPWLWFLRHNTDCQIFQEMTAPDIIKQIFQELGYSDFRQELTESYPTREYCVQYRESDYNFVTRLMEEEGIFFYFEHTKDKHTLVMCDSPAGYFNLDETEVQYTPIGQKWVKQLTGWRHVYEFRPGKVAQKDFNFKKPTDALVTDQTSQVAFEGSSNLEVYEYPGLYDETGKGDRLTKVRMEEIEADHDHVVGAGSYKTFTPGGKFDIEKHSRSSEEGRSYALVEVYTEFQSNMGFDTTDGEDFRNEFKCIPAETVFRPARTTTKPVVEGPQTAIVTTDGQEIVVDEHARVKVQFHWDRYGQKDINSSCWIRVSQHHSGGSWGMIDIPRQNEEVIVSFLDGDPDRPIITGRVYNGDNRTPFDLKGAGNNSKNKKRRGNITKTYEGEGYNELTMDDTEGEEQLRVHAQYNMDTAVLNDSMTHVLHDKHQIVGDEGEGGEGGGNHVELVRKDQHANIKRHKIEHVEGNRELMIGHGEADGGRRDVVIEKQDVKRVGDGGVHLDTAGSKISLIVGDEMSEVGGDYKHKVAGDVGIEAGKSNEIHIKAGMKIVLEAGADICLNAPGGFIRINSMGVTIQGIKVDINSGGSQIRGSAIKVDSVEPAREAKPADPLVADRFRKGG